MSICPFSKFKNLLGVPNKGIHRFRFLNTAIVDYIMSIIGACIITLFTRIPLVLTTIFVFVLGIILHILFGVETGVLKYFGIKC